MSLVESWLEVFLQYKLFLLSIFMIIILKFIKLIWNNKLKSEENYIKFESLSTEEKKILLITKFNTSINRNDPKEREKFIKKCNRYYF